MTGSIQPKKGYLYMVIAYKDTTGKSKEKWIATHLPEKGNKKAANTMLATWLREHQDCDLAYSNLLFADYLEQWIDSVECDLQRSSVRGYRDKLKHIIPYFRERKIKLSDLKLRDLESFYQTYLLNVKHLSPKSIRHCHRIISKALNDAIRKEMIQRNPATLARYP